MVCMMGNIDGSFVARFAMRKWFPSWGLQTMFSMMQALELCLQE
jgi:hypothetical protein